MINQSTEQIPHTGKILFLLLIPLLLYPLPTMLAIRSETPAILGRYEPLYFTLLVAYLIGVLIGTSLAIYVWRLPSDRIASIRRWVLDNKSKVSGGYLTAALIVFGGNYVLVAGLITLPGNLNSFISLQLFGLFLLIGYGVSLLVLPKRNDEVQEAPTLIIVSIIIGIFFAIFVFLAGRKGIWTLPIIGDQSAHIYMGQRVLAGDLPFVDFIHFQPPMRLVIASLWAMTAKLTSFSPVIIGRVYDLMIILFLSMLIYQSGRKFSGSRFAGLFGTVTFLGFEILLDVVTKSPNLKFSLAAIILASVMAGQSRRWFWSGVLACAALLFWLPAGAVGLGIILAILAQKEERIPSVFGFLKGATVIGSLVILILLATGLLDDAFRQVGYGTLTYIQSDGRGGDGGLLVGVLETFKRAGWWFPHEQVFLAFTGIGLFITIAGWVKGKDIRPEQSIPIIVGFLLLFMLLIDLQHKPDTLSLLPLIAILSAQGFWSMTKRLDGISGWMGIISVFTVFAVVSFPNGFTRYIPDKDLTLAQQVEMAEELDAMLEPDEVIQSFGDLWFPVLTMRENATRYNWLGPKSIAAIYAEGLTLEDVADAIVEENPVIVLASGRSLRDPIREMLDKNYSHIGDIRGQEVFVRNDSDHLITLISSWDAFESLDD